MCPHVFRGPNVGETNECVLPTVEGVALYIGQQRAEQTCSLRLVNRVKQIRAFWTLTCSHRAQAGPCTECSASSFPAAEIKRAAAGPWPFASLLLSSVTQVNTALASVVWWEPETSQPLFFFFFPFFPGGLGTLGSIHPDSEGVT